MWVKQIRSGHSKKRLAYSIRRWFARSRFTAEVTVEEKGVKILNVRLREKKPYCGNHPNACPVGGVNNRRDYLEGLDWAEVNDCLNDIMDRLGVDCRIESASCVIRRGLERRINYSSYTFDGRHYDWVRVGHKEYDYGNYVGAPAPPSEVPDGTNGLYKRKIAREYA
jgi:hypothetical protein